MSNPEVLKCHEDLITPETDNKFLIYVENINIFGYLGAWWGGGGGGELQ